MPLVSLCVNVDGYSTGNDEEKGYRCDCKDGYHHPYVMDESTNKIMVNKNDCVDFDECYFDGNADNEEIVTPSGEILYPYEVGHKCHENAECLNTGGSYRCECQCGFLFSQIYFWEKGTF